MKYGIVFAIVAALFTTGFSSESHARNRGALLGALAAAAVVSAILAPHLKVRAAPRVRSVKTGGDVTPVAVVIVNPQETENYATMSASADVARSMDR